jgi:hypothetical protein
MIQSLQILFKGNIMAGTTDLFSSAGKQGAMGKATTEAQNALTMSTASDVQSQMDTTNKANTIQSMAKHSLAMGDTENKSRGICGDSTKSSI